MNRGYGQSSGLNDLGRQGNSDRGTYGSGTYFGSGNYGSGMTGNSGSGSWNGGNDSSSNAGRQGNLSGAHKGKGPKGYRRSDDRIKEDISDRLSDDSQIDASDIEVSVDNGVVSLTGTVDDRDLKRRVEDLAESISGVSNVENRLRVSKDNSSDKDSMSDRKSTSSSSSSSSTNGHSDSKNKRSLTGAHN